MKALEKIETANWPSQLRRLRKSCLQLIPQLINKYGRIPSSARPVVEAALSVQIFESELSAICRNAAKRGWEETGGHFFGAISRGSPVVMVATPAGKAASHSTTDFVQDLDYYRACDRYLSEHQGLHLIGRWHSHHTLGLSRPSAGDLASAKSIMEKNGMSVFVEFILTLDAKSGVVRVHAYVYLAGELFEARPAKLIILPGVSPMREAAFGSVVFADHKMFEWRYPQERFVIDGEPAGTAGGIPKALEQQIGQLPAQVLSETQVVREGEAISIELPLSESARGYVGYCYKTPEHPTAVLLRRSETEAPVDVSEAVNPTRKPLSLTGVYRRLHRISLYGTGEAIGAGTSPGRDTVKVSGQSRLNAAATNMVEPKSTKPVQAVTINRKENPASQSSRRCFKSSPTTISKP